MQGFQLTQIHILWWSGILRSAQKQCSRIPIESACSLKRLVHLRQVRHAARKNQWQTCCVIATNQGQIRKVVGSNLDRWYPDLKKKVKIGPILRCRHKDDALPVAFGLYFPPG